MALTKVRLPVADIAAISDGTSNVNVESTNGDITVDVGGTNIGTFSATGLDLNTLQLAAQVLDVRDLDLTNGSVTAQYHADASEGKLGTTSAHPLAIMANSIDALDVATDGKVTLNVEGTAASHLVTKSYVDVVSNNSVQTSDVVGNTSVTGSISIPNSTGNDLIINWGITSSLSNDASEVQTFDTAFPNAFLCAVASPNRGLGGNGTFNIDNETTTQMTLYNTTNSTCAGYWIAIGY